MATLTEVRIGDALEVLRTMPSASVHCVVTSPPYWGLRDYGVEGQIGLEPSPAEWVARLVEVFAEVKRVLRNDGVCWVNVGSSYASDDIFSQTCILREDVSDEEVIHVGMVLFGLRFDQSEAAGQGYVPDVLQDSMVECQEGHQSSRSRGRIETILPTQPQEGPGSNCGPQPQDEMGSDPGAGRSVRVLRRDESGIHDCRSYQRRRRGTQEKTDRERAIKLDQDLSRDQATGLPSRQVQGALLQLQLRHRMLGLLPTLEISERFIPASIRSFFRCRKLFKKKDLIDQPNMLATALRMDGWYCRSEIIWAKPSPMPESVRDRPTKAHETVFLLTKSGEATFWTHRDGPGTRTRPAPDWRWVNAETGEEVAEEPAEATGWKRINLWRGRDYFYDAEAIREKAESFGRQHTSGTQSPKTSALKANGYHGEGCDLGLNYERSARNARTVWTIATEAFSDSHFATMPSELARRCILAGTSAKGCCPECGAPWARVVETVGYDRQRWAPGVDQYHTQAKGRHGATSAFSTGDVAVKSTTGWRPTCDHDAAPIPCTVLDIFGGSGTTALAAEQLGRDAILIELSPEYAAMAERRIAKWRARRALGDGEHVAVLPGQLGLPL